MKSDYRTFLGECSKKYKDDLVNNIMPFWLKNGMDSVNGGLYTCLDRDGTIYDTTKSVWFQGRFGYVASYAYNHIEQKEEWLAASKSCINFAEEHCFDCDGHMFFEVEADGTPMRRRRYVFSECFSVIAMAEYSKATNSPEYTLKALELFKKILEMLSTKGFLPSKYLESVKMRGHSITMILINTALCLKQVCDAPIVTNVINNNIDELAKHFIKPEFEALLETVGENGEFIDSSTGRLINPGHAIETAWFLMDAAPYTDRKDEVEKMALQILDWSWKWGWDEKYGGIINFRDCKNFPVQDYSQDMKFWWPQCEAIIASLYAYKISGNEKYLEMHKLAHNWAYDNFDDKEFGEWFGYLHRDGAVAQPAKGNIFKGPFHIPRMMIKAHLLIESILTI